MLGSQCSSRKHELSDMERTRNISFSIIASFILASCSATTSNETYIVKSDDVFERIRFVNIENRQFEKIRIGLLDNACLDLVVLQKSASGISEFNCIPRAENIVSQELSRILTKLDINKKI